MAILSYNFQSAKLNLPHSSIFVGFTLRLKAKVACKVLSEHHQVRDLPPPNETVAKMTLKTSAMPGMSPYTY